MHNDFNDTWSLRPFGLGKSFATVYDCYGQQRKSVFFCHAENAVLERKHMTVVAAVPFGEYRNGHVVFEALFYGGSHAKVLARVPVNRYAADFSQDPAEHGNFPEFRFCNERGHGDGRPNDVDVQKTLVVGNEYELLVARDILLADYFDLDSRKFEKHVEKWDTHAGTVGPTPTKNALVEHERNADYEKTDCDKEIVEYCSEKSHNNPKMSVYTYNVYFLRRMEHKNEKNMLALCSYRPFTIWRSKTIIY